MTEDQGSGSPPPGSYPPKSHPPGSLVRSRRIAHLLDDLIPIPGTPFRVGLDPLLGLLPGAGDVLSWVVSLHLLWTGWRMRAGPATLIRMASHLVVDVVVGAIPALGDLFDVAYRANDRNLRILEGLHADPDRTRRSSLLWLIGVVGVSGGILAGVLWGIWRLASAVLGLFG